MAEFNGYARRHRHPQAFDVRVLLAFAAIYVLWGGTFLAIRVAVLEVPPLFASGVRFFIAGGLLYVFMRLRGEPVSLRSAVARHRHCIPMHVRRDLRGALLGGTIRGFGSHLCNRGDAPDHHGRTRGLRIPAAAVSLAYCWQRWCWGSAGSSSCCSRAGRSPSDPAVPGGPAGGSGLVARRGADPFQPRPKSLQHWSPAPRCCSAGAVLLALSAAAGEMHTWPVLSRARRRLALLYLIVAGSLIGFTAYLWLLTQMPATRVASHAYVNPLVAVALGYFVAGEVTHPANAAGCRAGGDGRLPAAHGAAGSDSHYRRLSSPRRQDNGNTERMARRDPARAAR